MTEYCFECGEPVETHTEKEAHACYIQTFGEQSAGVENLLEIINDAASPLDSWKIECGHPQLVYSIDLECSWLDDRGQQEQWSMRLTGETIEHVLEKAALALEFVMDGAAREASDD